MSSKEEGGRDGNETQPEHDDAWKNLNKIDCPSLCLLEKYVQPCVAALEERILMEEKGANDVSVVVVAFEHKSFQRKEIHDGTSGPLDRTAMPYVSTVPRLRETIGEGLEEYPEHLGRRTRILVCVVQYGEPSW